MSLKILFLTHKFYPDIGGIEINSEILANAFHIAGNSVKLITWTENSEDKIFPFQVIRKPSKLALFKEHNWAEVVFENNPCLRLSWPSVFFNKPSVVAIRTWIDKTNGSFSLQNKVKMQWLFRATAVIAVSNSIRDRCWPAATVIGNPYRESLFKILPDVPRVSDFVFLGRLVSDKGADQAIIALSRLLKENKNGKQLYPDLSLTIVGDGSDRQSLEQLAVDHGVADYITFTGSLDGEELVSCLNRHRYLLVPSLWEEPFGNVALEGMACGCIPIVSDGGGLPDAVGEAGIVFKRGDIDDFVGSIKSVLDNENLNKQLRTAAEIHLQAHHPDIVSQHYMDIVETAFNQRRL